MYEEPSHSPLDAAGVFARTHLITIKNGLQFSEHALRQLLPDVGSALFFGKLYELDYHQLSELIRTLFRSDIIDALFGESTEHSSDLQDYLIDMVPDDIVATHGGLQVTDEQPSVDTEVLAQAVASARVTVAQSIAEVADTLGDVLARFPSKEGQMAFQHMMKFNAQRATIGTFDPYVARQRIAKRIVVLDVSGSVSENTVRRIAGEVVGMAYDIEAYLAIVSENAFLYEPGTFSVDTVLRDAEYWGTHYEMLTPIFHEDWETAITIADYDSAWTAQDHLAKNARGRIGQVLDFSLVNRPTFLSEVLGRIAGEVKPILIGNSEYLLS